MMAGVGRKRNGRSGEKLLDKQTVDASTVYCLSVIAIALSAQARRRKAWCVTGAGSCDAQTNQLCGHPDAGPGSVAHLLDRADGLYHRHRSSHRGETLD